MFAIDERPDLLAHLTPEQRAAATYDGGHLLIVAGAGTGKTTALTARLVHLVQSGVDPSRILLLTFSRRAASELLGRAEAVAGRAVTGAAWGGTFHAVANRLLRRHARSLGLDPSFTVLDQGDVADLLSLVRDEVAEAGEGPARRRVKPDTMASIISRCVNARTPLKEVVQRWFPWCVDDLPDLKATFAGYTARKREHHVVDYDDLLLCWLALLGDPDVAPQLQRRFDHILVDEYQDTNALQADLLEGMAAGGATVTAVGDDAQAIYGFRAATQRNILDFPARFGAELLLLERNHRSTPPLLLATNAVIAEAKERHAKTLWSIRGGDARAELVTCADEGAQSAAVCERILGHLERGTPLRGQAVLVRTGHHSDLLELELAVRGIPFVKYGGLRFLEAAHVKDLLALCRLVENQRDELAWFRVLQLLDGIGPATARKITASAGLLDSTSPLDRLASDPPALTGPAQQGLATLVAALADAAGPELAGRPGPQVERVRAWLDPLVERRHGHGTARVADFEQLTLAASAAPTLERFLVDLALDPPASTGELAGPPSLDDDVLTISTIHSAKGLEWDVVHVLHLADGNVPSDLATGDDDEIEEERRLLYVAMTRARDHLHTYFPLRYHHRKKGRDDAHGYAQLTRFFTLAVLGHLEQAGPRRPAPDDPAESPWRQVRAPLAQVDALLGALWE